MKIIIKNKSSMYDVIKELWKDIDDDYLVVCTSELARYRLIVGAIREKKRIGIDAYVLTTLGEKYVKWIFSPISMDMINNKI